MIWCLCGASRCSNFIGQKSSTHKDTSTDIPKVPKTYLACHKVNGVGNRFDTKIDRVSYAESIFLDSREKQFLAHITEGITKEQVDFETKNISAYLLAAVLSMVPARTGDEDNDEDNGIIKKRSTCVA